MTNSLSTDCFTIGQQAAIYLKNGDNYAFKRQEDKFHTILSHSDRDEISVLRNSYHSGFNSVW
jgi:hypothetical protein